ncbi:MAG: ethanolamine ammonia-lyase subunit EutC [Gemmataceae bacterium]
MTPHSLQPADPATDALVRLIQARTPARLLVGRAGASYRSGTQLQLCGDHAAARDAVGAELDCDWLAGQGLREVGTRVTSKAEFLRRPDLGRRLNDAGRALLAEEFPRDIDLQIVVGDGLSAPAVVKQVPSLLPVLRAGTTSRGWSVGTPFAVRYCRVGVLNDIGELLHPRVAVLLIGERPGLATAESLSAYLAYRPRPDHTDARRNLISNIHERGVSIADAARRILVLAETMMRQQTSGVAVKEEFAPRLPAPAARR